MKSNRLNIKIVGRVIYGNGLGRKLGFPTANIDATLSDLSIAEGVYAARTEVDGQTYGAVVNIGRSPSVIVGGGIRIEAHLIGFEGNLYGRTLAIELLAFLRSEQKFGTLEQLAAQIERDKNEAAQISASIE